MNIKDYLVIAVLMAAIAFVAIHCSGCQTVKGAMGDTSWLLKTGADNIQTSN